MSSRQHLDNRISVSLLQRVDWVSVIKQNDPVLLRILLEYVYDAEKVEESCGESDEEEDGRNGRTMYLGDEYEGSPDGSDEDSATESDDEDMDYEPEEDCDEEESESDSDSEDVWEDDRIMLAED